MEKVASEIVTKMMSADLISEDEAASYRYGVQILIEKIFSYAIIFSLAIILNRFLEVLLFFISFSIIRKYSGGIHCRHFETCLIASTLVSFSGIGLFPLVEKSILTYQGGVIMSIIIVFLIGAINNPNIDWSDCEYRKVRKLSRLIVALESSVLILLLMLQFPFNYRFYISYGIVVCAISMLLEIRKKGGIAYEDSREECLETC
ncbi:MAG: accessory gene regulator B family protein [Clostridiales bacterium]|nr:accessory gene regulator B family protein [Clostridiales bacterium]